MSTFMTYSGTGIEFIYTIKSLTEFITIPSHYNHKFTETKITYFSSPEFYHATYCESLKK